MPTTIAQANSSVEAARQRRAGSAEESSVRIEWFIKEVVQVVAMAMKERVTMATQLLKDRVVRNISKAVVKGVGSRGGRVVGGRSGPGEFPRADTTLLMTSIFSDVREDESGVFDGYVGTPLNYGLILETKMNRSFLKRTLNESLNDVQRILSGPIA